MTTPTYKIAGKEVSSTGFGLMGLTWRASPPSQEQSLAAMKAALDNGANFWNGGEIYGTPERNTLHLLREYFDKYPNDASKGFISIKGGFEKGGYKPDCSPANVRRSIDECLSVLGGTKSLDMFECTRVDPSVPIEIAVRTINEYVKAGKVGGIGLTECSAETIRRAAKEAPISAVEVEFSLWSTEIVNNGVLQACRDLKIPIIAYSPLGRGFLTGQVKTRDDIPDDDMRKQLPRFSAENFPKNLELVSRLQSLADSKGCTAGQVAIAWVKAQSGRNGNPAFIPIPGATTEQRVKENMVDVHLAEEDLEAIDRILASVEVAGNRYFDAFEGMNFGDSISLEEYEAKQ